MSQSMKGREEKVISIDFQFSCHFMSWDNLGNDFYERKIANNEKQSIKSIKW